MKVLALLASLLGAGLWSFELAEHAALPAGK